jgi:hypothetical protein
MGLISRLKSTSAAGATVAKIKGTKAIRRWAGMTEDPALQYRMSRYACKGADSCRIPARSGSIHFPGPPGNRQPLNGKEIARMVFSIALASDSPV